MKYRILIILLLSYYSTTIHAGGADVFSYQEGRIITLFPHAQHKEKHVQNNVRKTSANKISTINSSPRISSTTIRTTGIRSTASHSSSITTEVTSD